VIDAASAPLSAPGLWLIAAERWLLLAGLAVALGGLAGRGLARQYKGPRGTVPLPAPWALRGSLLGMAASLALAVTADIDPGLAIELARPRAPGLPANATAVIATVEFACFALAALLLRLRRPGNSVLPLLGVGLAEGVRAHPEGIVTAAGAALSYCHLLPALTWAGMLFYTLRAGWAWRADPAAMQGLIRFYGNAAAWLFAWVAITGVVSALLLVPLGSLLTTAYGRFLIVKAAVVTAVACLAVAGRVWLHRRPPAGAGPALVTKLECGALAVVLAVTSLLTVLTPPAKPIFTSAASCRSVRRAPPPAGASACRIPRTTGSDRRPTAPAPAPGAPR
jgi:Copper resistance protein D